MKTALHVLIAIAVGLILNSCSDDDSPVSPDSEYISAEALLEENGFQGSILIRKGNSDFLRQGFGMANNSAGIANDPALIYRIGSMTKAFTAMGMVALKRDGLIDSYEQTLSEFDPDFPNGNQITLRHMLTHYSGLPDYTGPIEAAAQDQYFSPEDIYEVLKESTAEDGFLFEPGSQFNYSNSNYLILGLLIEELSGMPYHDYLQAKVFGPLSLINTTKGPDEITEDSHAKGYRDGNEVAPYQMQLANSGGDLVSTIADLEKWGDALMGSDFLTADERADVFAAPYTEDGYFTSGMGWFTIKTNGTLIYNHGGNINGFTSVIALLPETNSMIIMLSNQEEWAPINEVLEALVINEF